MDKRKLGNSALEVAPLALGTNVFGWTIDEPTAFTILDKFVSSGFNLIDTADVYAKWKTGNRGGESETIIGNWMKQRKNRDKVTIATKVGMELSPEKKGLSKNYILAEVEDSLKRLQTDYIDLYQSHTNDPNTPVEETLEAYSLLVKSGKVRAIGASNFTRDRLAESVTASKKLGFPRYESLQPPYNLFDRNDYETKLEPFCLESNIGVISYYGLARGFLSGKYRSEADLSKSPRGQGVKKYLDERGFAILKALDDVSAQLNSKPARVAIAWLVARPSITAPISSATSLEQLDDLIEGARLKLNNSHIELLNSASKPAVAE